MRIGTAGWSIPKAHAGHFSAEGSHLVRYAQVLNCVEVNSSFYREHQRKTYERWSRDTPDDFKFSVKLSKTFTHIQKLKVEKRALGESIHSISGLGKKFGALLVQLPPSLSFDSKIARKFFESLRSSYSGKVVIEPRHLTWASASAVRTLLSFSISKVFADPEPVLYKGDTSKIHEAGGLVYFRLHGSPQIYKSNYSKTDLKKIRQKLVCYQNQGIDSWCIFDNTTFGHATGNAVDLKADSTSQKNSQIA